MKNNELCAKFERNNSLRIDFKNQKRNNSLRIDFKNQKRFFVEK